MSLSQETGVTVEAVQKELADLKRAYEKDKTEKLAVLEADYKAKRKELFVGLSKTFTEQRKRLRRLLDALQGERKESENDANGE